jgi:hypothetical protein
LSAKFIGFIPIAVSIISVLLMNFFLSHHSFAIEKYVPSVSLNRHPDKENDPVYSLQDAEITAKVHDKFGRITTHTLSYSTDEGKSWTTLVMDLIYGTHSNGTYVGRIHLSEDQRGNFTVKYKVYFEDDLHYSFNGSDEYSVVDFVDRESPTLRFVGQESTKPLGSNVTISTLINDFPIGETLNSGVNENLVRLKLFDSKKQLKDTIPMTSGSAGIYQGVIPAHDDDEVNTVVWYTVEAYDYAKNRKETEFNNYTIVEASLSTKVDVTTEILDSDIRILALSLAVTIQGENPDVNHYQPFIITYKDENNLKTTTKKYYELPNSQSADSDSKMRIPFSNLSLALEGDAKSFPFDEYSSDFTLVLPIKNASSQHLYNIADSVGAVWDISNKTDSGKHICDKVYASNPSDKRICEHEGTSVQNIQLHSKRNHTQLSIIVPLISVFFLVGSIFILNVGDVSERLTLTLGVFAFIFTLTPIIDAAKPITTNVPTIADLIITLLIVSTIAFSISSVINSKVERKWLDKVVFLFIISIITIFGILYYPGVSVWLVPVIIFALGYGFIITSRKIVLHYAIKVGRKLLKASRRLGFSRLQS